METDRQTTIARLRADGTSLRAIAAALGISLASVQRALARADTPDTPTVHYAPKLYLTHFRRLPSILTGKRVHAMITNLPKPAPQSLINILEALAEHLLTSTGFLSIRVNEDPASIANAVRRLTKPGALVVDPMVGRGTVAEACYHLGRRFVGCDTNEKAVYAVMKRFKAPR